MRWIDDQFELDRDAGIPLYVQIQDAVRRAIREGRLKSGDRLPSVSALAGQFGVTPTTVLRAFDDLVQCGSLVCHVGRGTFVADPSAAASTPREGESRGPGRQIDPGLTDTIRRMRGGVARSLEALLTLADRPGLIRFTKALPDPDLVDRGVVERIIDEVRRQKWAELADCPSACGLPGLREAVADRLSSARRKVSPENVLITSGSQQAVSLLAQAALGRRWRVLCEMPCYIGIPRAFEALGHWVEPVNRDLQGPIPARLDALRGGGPSILYVNSELQNPHGTDLSPERRTWLLEWARGEEVLLLADEIFHDLRFEGPTPESLLTDAESGRAAVIGSISKTIMSGLRIGWLVGSRDLVAELLPLKRAADIGCPPLNQAIARWLLRSGEYDAHLERIRDEYRHRCRVTLQALEEHMPDGVTWTRPPGGFNLWVELPAGYSSVALFLLAIERGVAVIPGPNLDINHRFLHAFRLSYGYPKREKIAEGVKRLGVAVRELLRRSPDEPGLANIGEFQ